ncbi:hypothetical protein N7528_008446 [Penicillium herquei]|nr:hypothetical protein N7528_008446 [Penicillium herquei]
MAGEPQQKRRRLPFKPPSRTSSAGTSTGSSTAAKDKGKAKETTSKPSKPTASSSSVPKAQPTASSSTSAGKRARDVVENTLPATPSDFATDSESEAGDVERPVSEEPDYILAEITHPAPEEDITTSAPQINPKLLTGIFHHFFKNEKTRISKDADAMMAKYMDLFVREAIARGKLERDLVNESKGRSGPADNFIEVEDLETLAPWLVMDF